MRKEAKIIVGSVIAAALTMGLKGAAGVLLVSFAFMVFGDD